MSRQRWGRDPIMLLILSRGGPLIPYQLASVMPLREMQAPDRHLFLPQGEISYWCGHASIPGHW